MSEIKRINTRAELEQKREHFIQWPPRISRS